MTTNASVSLPRRAAFTLIELMVAVSILLAVMAMVGVIFSTAGKASGLAQATQAVYRDQRASAAQIRSDLEYCHPGDKAILMIAGNEVVAHSTQRDAESARALSTTTNDDIHRADVLVFTTERDIPPHIFKPQNYSGIYAGNPRIELEPTSLVTYGHADIGRIIPTNASETAYEFNAPNTTYVQNVTRPPVTIGGFNYFPSDMPASTWHLGRRVTRFPRNAYWTGTPLVDGMWPQVLPARWDLATRINPPVLATDLWPISLAFSQGRADLYEYSFSNQTDWVAGSPQQRYPCVLDYVSPGYYLYQNLTPVNSVMQYMAFRFRNTLFRVEKSNAGDPGQVYALVNDNWFRDIGAGHGCPNGTNAFQRTDQTGGTLPAPNTPLCLLVPGPDPTSTTIPALWDPRYVVYNPLQGNRTLLDPSPPAGAASRMGAYFLPNCSDFMVEYTYDNPSEVVLAPDPTTTGAWAPVYQVPVRWQRVPNGQQIVWSRLSVTPNNYSDPDDVRNRTDPIRWPRALRITLRSWGPGSTLEAPVEQVIIHTFDR